MSDVSDSQKAIMDSRVSYQATSADPSRVEEAPVKKKRAASYFNILFSGFALLSDGYQSGVISFINLFLGKIYGPEIFNATMKSRLSYSMFVGAIVGQVGMYFVFILLYIEGSYIFFFLYMCRFRFNH